MTVPSGASPRPPGGNVAIHETDLPPCGVGEPEGVPTAAAIVRAIHAASGRRLRDLQLARTEIIWERRARRVLRPNA